MAPCDTVTVMHSDSVEVDDVLEHAMRISNDEVAVERLVTCELRDRLAALGQLLSSASHSPGLSSGDPLLSWVTGTPLNSTWRSRFSSAPATLWNDLEGLRLLTCSVSATNLLEEWRVRRRLFDERLG